VISREIPENQNVIVQCFDEKFVRIQPSYFDKFFQSVNESAAAVCNNLVVLKCCGVQTKIIIKFKLVQTCSNRN
jgi:hypothetical protein